MIQKSKFSLFLYLVLMFVIVENMPHKDMSIPTEEINCWLYFLNNSVHFSVPSTNFAKVFFRNTAGSFSSYLKSAGPY